MSRLTVDPLHLSVTEDPEVEGGRPHNVHILENGDLAVREYAGALLEPAEDGQLVFALGVDQDHDEIHYCNQGDHDAEETLKRALEALQLALEAVSRVKKL
jgi:hypothetical protein